MDTMVNVEYPLPYYPHNTINDTIREIPDEYGEGIKWMLRNEPRITCKVKRRFIIDE